MNGAFLLIPFMLIRFGLLSILNKEATRRAAHFPPMIGKEKAAYWLYQLSTVAIFVYLFFLQIEIEPSWLFYTGLFIYTLGTVACTISIINFAKPSESGINLNGLYRISRNPMYMAYLIFFLGCVVLTKSPMLLGFVLVFQVSTHWIILAEERWCISNFGEKYRQYMKKVRRYI
ncbi:MAG: isoprenylcysteine carboxylmethyltransferase family protein [Candidatus Bathyarchaeota archaeon]|nr:isoprenylcysteine carboxylmethyltransferase family protein [Candidatus Termiticorpusculum sp.]